MENRAWATTRTWTRRASGKARQRTRQKLATVPVEQVACRLQLHYTSTSSSTCTPTALALEARQNPATRKRASYDGAIHSNDDADQKEKTEPAARTSKDLGARIPARRRLDECGVLVQQSVRCAQGTMVIELLVLFLSAIRIPSARPPSLAPSKFHPSHLPPPSPSLPYPIPIPPGTNATPRRAQKQRHLPNLLPQRLSCGVDHYAGGGHLGPAEGVGTRDSLPICNERC